MTAEESSDSGADGGGEGLFFPDRTKKKKQEEELIEEEQAPRRKKRQRRAKTESPEVEEEEVEQELNFAADEADGMFYPNRAAQQPEPEPQPQPQPIPGTVYQATNNDGIALTVMGLGRKDVALIEVMGNYLVEHGFLPMNDASLVFRYALQNLLTTIKADIAETLDHFVEQGG